VSELRQYKDADEIEIMLRNAGLVRDVLESTGHELRPGMSEMEIWSSVISGLRRKEPESLQLYGNCASGPRTLEPDPHASPRIIQAGEPLLLDVYPRIDGYFADLSRTWCCGTVTSQMGRMIDAVRETLDATAAMITPGVRGIEVDYEARAMLTRHGYPDAYPHHTGHGLGVKQQERPWIRPRSPDVIQEGMVIALEPACYVDGVGGVRLEDEFLVTAAGAHSLTGLTRSVAPAAEADRHAKPARNGRRTA
jgi:Xaa-Pro aminopeptidase